MFYVTLGGEKMSLEKVLGEINKIGDATTIGEIASQLMNALMQKEREIKLREDANNKANGYYQRQIISELGRLGLKVPRDRKGEFRPALLPDHWQRGDEGFQNFMTKLVLSGYSPNKIKGLLHSMGLPYSNEQIEELKEELHMKAKELKGQELPEEVGAIFIDAYHMKIKEEGKIKKGVIYTVIGIDLEGTKNIYGYYIYYGSENRSGWLEIFNDLIKRGLKKPLIIVSDDFSGLSEAIKTLYPRADHQLCYIHMQRNVKKNMSKEDAKEFNRELSRIRKSKDFEQALQEFEVLCKKYKDKYSIVHL